MFRKNSRVLPGGSSNDGLESLERRGERSFPNIDSNCVDCSASIFSTTAPARLVRDLAFLNDPGDPTAEPLQKEQSPRGALGGRITPAEIAAQRRADHAAAVASDAAQVIGPSSVPGALGTLTEKPLNYTSSLTGAPTAATPPLASSTSGLPPIGNSAYKTGNDILADIMGLESSLKERYSVNAASKQQQPPSSASSFASSAERNDFNFAVSAQVPLLDGISLNPSRAGADIHNNTNFLLGSVKPEASSWSELSSCDLLASNGNASMAQQLGFLQENKVKNESGNYWDTPGPDLEWAYKDSNNGRNDGQNQDVNGVHHLNSPIPPENATKKDSASNSSNSSTTSVMHTSNKGLSENSEVPPNKVKGVSAGVMHVPGLLDSLKTTSTNSSSSSSGGDVLLRFANALHVTPEVSLRRALLCVLQMSRSPCNPSVGVDWISNSLSTLPL